jgi:hypothetical protein
MAERTNSVWPHAGTLLREVRNGEEERASFRPQQRKSLWLIGGIGISYWFARLAGSYNSSKKIDGVAF